MLSANRFRRAATNSTATAFTAQVPTTTEPTEFKLLGDGKWGVPDYVLLIPFGKDGNDDTFDMRLWGWTVTEDGYYIPQLLVDLSVVLGNIAAGFAASTFLADTITINDGPADLDGAFENSPWLSVSNNAEDLAANILVHTRGCQYITFDYDRAGGQEGTECNCLWRPVDRVHGN